MRRGAGPDDYKPQPPPYHTTFLISLSRRGWFLGGGGRGAGGGGVGGGGGGGGESSYSLSGLFQTPNPSQRKKCSLSTRTIFATNTTYDETPSLVQALRNALAKGKIFRAV